MDLMDLNYLLDLMDLNYLMDLMDLNYSKTSITRSLDNKVLARPVRGCKLTKMQLPSTETSIIRSSLALFDLHSNFEDLVIEVLLYLMDLMDLNYLMDLMDLVDLMVVVDLMI